MVTAPAEDAALLEALRAGDESAFTTFVERHATALLRVARLYVKDGAVAEEVVQDTWIGFLGSLDRFEGRASLRTWLFRIMINVARKRRVREARTIPFASLWDEGSSEGERAVDEERFLGAKHRWTGHWTDPPRPWASLPEAQLLARETRGHIETAIEELPRAQREVIMLRDVEGWAAPEVCDALGLSEANQRVLLHRARARVRRSLELYLEGEPG